MNIPFRFRKLPLYTYDYDGMFPTLRIVGKDKRYERKKQIRRYLENYSKE